VPRDRRRERERALDARARRRAERAAQRRPLREPLELLSEGRHLARRDEDAGHALLDELRQPADAARDHR
jgi:hypothetical protein